MQYKLDRNVATQQVRDDVILKIVDGIRFTVGNNPENPDWRDYQAWLDLGNEPEEADPIENEEP